MVKGASVVTHLNEFNTIVNQLSSVEINFNNEVRALILLASLPNNWEPMQAVVSNSVGNTKLNFNDVRDRILAEEVRIIDSGEMLASNSALNIEVDSPIDPWVLDSGASFHTTAQREILENYVAGNHGKVYLADGEPLDIVGTGSIRLKMSNGVVWKIQKVRHVLKLMQNLISVGQLDDEGHNATFCEGSMVVAHDGHMSERGMKMLVSNGKDLRKGKLELVHTDVWGPSSVSSLDVMFIDDSTIKEWVYFIKNESNVFATFKRGPSVPLNYSILKEVSSSKDAKYSFLKVFGCLSYVHIDAFARNKFDPKSKKCFFIGYGDTEFDYCFWNDENRKIIRSRDVIFSEQVLYKDRLSKSSEIADSVENKSGVFHFKDFPMNNLQQNAQNEENILPTNQENVAPETTPLPELRRSSRTGSRNPADMLTKTEKLKLCATSVGLLNLKIEKSLPLQMETVDGGLVSKWKIVNICGP
ncbi:hypothetical protein ZIOFF_015364 [Zingiber officinale]|uniref:Retrovirus-related Pol polyprotein from transposon TNT 1-94 n=1 Tax=Zingiber officinale TaxID=94328 RepID=A0A8J5HZE1_ZINOF|nr:hypothetical protein ZIOFF_015364 [Zingiber officinale]